MTVTGPPPDTTLRIVRVFKAPRARVFTAFVEPEALRQWFCPEGFRFEDITIDPATGRGASFTMVHEATGGRYCWELAYTVVDPPKRLEWTSIWHEGFPDPGRETFVTVTFADVAGGTEVTLVHENLVDAAVRDDHGQGWNSGLDKLARWMAAHLAAHGTEIVSPGSAGV